MAQAGPSKYRDFKGATGKALSVFAVALTLYHVLYITGILSRLRVLFFTPQHTAIHLGGMLALIFWLIPARKGAPRDKLPWYDIVLMFLGLGWNLYLVINYAAIDLRVVRTGILLVPESLMVWVSFLILFEAARRVAGLSIAIIAAAFLIYPLVGDRVPGIFAGANYSWDRVARSVGLFVTGMYGSILNISATLVISFFLFAQLLAISGAGQWFIDIAQALMGHVRGGSAKASVFASSLLGMVEGLATSNVATIGVFTIPLMKRTGYPAHLAAAIEAVSSNGGQIMPPVLGIAAFIMVDFLGMGYNKIVVASILPAVVYYAAVFFVVDFEAAKSGLVGIPRSELPSLGKTLIQGWLFVVPLAVLLIFMLHLQYSPQLSALYASAALILISFFKKKNRITPGKLYLALKSTATTMMMIAVFMALSGMIVGSVDLTGLGYRLSFLLIQASGENLMLLMVVTAIACLILGTGLSTSAVYILLAILAAPALIKLGMMPLAAHFFVFYFGLAANVTPPVCHPCFIAAGIADAPPMKTGFTATRLSIATFVVPFIFAYNPALLMQGTPLSIVLVTVTTLVSVLGLAAGLGGYLLRPMNYFWRALVIAGGLLMVYPETLTIVIGMAAIAVTALYQLVTPKPSRSSAAPTTR